jgi:hypothetical protein
MKFAFAFLVLTTTLQAQSIYIKSGDEARTIEFDPYRNESRTIHFRMVDGKREIISDETIPEGVGYISILNPATGRGAIQYTRKYDFRFYRPTFLMPSFPMYYFE